MPRARADSIFAPPAQDVEVQRAAEGLRRAQGVLAATGEALVAPVLGNLACFIFLHDRMRSASATR